MELIDNKKRKTSSSVGSISYMSGFGNEFSTEALPDALPKSQNSPQQCPYGLYAEQLSGTSFTAPRHSNQRSWLYRIRPSVCHTKYENIDTSLNTCKLNDFSLLPDQFRWNPMPLPEPSMSIDFVAGLSLLCGAGDDSLKKGLAIYTYSANVSMSDSNKVFQNSDGDFLIVPQTGTLNIKTEFGVIVATPCEIIVIQRGIKFSVDISEPSRGYILEIKTGHFDLPNLGPIGANCLANPRDFETPVACFEDIDEPFTIINKFGGSFFQAHLSYSPYNVVAWHGNYAPYKYDLRKFSSVNSCSFDHPDPSIFTVLTCPGDEPGTATADFVIFPPRWMVAEHTFRPPYFHRNCMSEYMGMIYGEYDGKTGGFAPGGGSLHSCMTGHGPDAATFLRASTVPLSPTFLGSGLAFMFETTHLLKLNPLALQVATTTSTTNSSTATTVYTNTAAASPVVDLFPRIQADYLSSWRTLPKIFDGTMNPKFV